MTLIVNARRHLRDLVQTWLTDAHANGRLTVPVLAEHIYRYKTIPPMDAPTAVAIFTQNPVSEMTVIGHSASIMPTFAIVLFASMTEDSVIREGAEDFLDEAESELIRQLGTHSDPLWLLANEIQNGLRDRIPALRNTHRTAAILIDLELRE